MPGNSNGAREDAALVLSLASNELAHPSPTRPETQPEPNRRARRAADKPPRKQPRGTLARTIWRRRKFGRVHVSVEPDSRIEGLNRVFDTDAEADAHVTWLRSEYGWLYVDEGAAEPLREPARHLATPAVHVLLRPDNSFLVGVSPRPRGEKPPMTFFDADKAAAYGVWLARRHGPPSTGPLEILYGVGR